MQATTNLKQILLGCANRERNWQKELYMKYYGFAMSICMRYIPNPEETAEVVNDGFLKVFNSISRFNPTADNPEPQLMAWIKKLLVNTCIDQLRTKKKNLFVSDLDAVPEHISTEDLAVDRMTYAELLGMVDKLSPAYKTIFNLFVIDGFSHEEIAGLLKIGVGTSKSNLSKARVQLQKILREAEFDLYGKKVC